MSARVRYLVADANGQLHKVPQRALEAIWYGDRQVSSLNFPVGPNLPVVTAVVDENLAVEWVGFMRVPYLDGVVTSEARAAIGLLRMELCVLQRYPLDWPEALRHIEGWPGDVFQQIATALDVPMAEVVSRLAFFSPLVAASQLRVSMQNFMATYWPGTR